MLQQCWYTKSLSKDWQTAINVRTWKALHKEEEDQYAYFTLAASLTWGMSSSSFRISLNWNKGTLCKSVSVWTDVCQDLVSDSCHFTQDTQPALWHVHLLILAAAIKQCLLCVLLNYMTLSNIQTYWVLQSHNFMWNLCCWQKLNIYIYICSSSGRVPDDNTSTQEDLCCYTQPHLIQILYFYCIITLLWKYSMQSHMNSFYICQLILL